MRENELYERICSGDGAALDELISGYYPEILRYCTRHAPAGQGEDAAQETFLKAVRHLDAYIHRGRFRAWLYKIASNVCADCWRAAPGAEELGDLPQTEPGFELAELSADLAGALASLESGQREVIELRYLQGLKLRECAEVLGIPLRTVQSRSRAALKALRKLL